MVNKTLCTSFLLLFLTVSIVRSQETLVSSAIVAKGLKDSAAQLGWSLDRATANGDFALEKSLRQLQLLSDTLTRRLEVEMSKNREFVSNELSVAVRKLSELIEKGVPEKILELQDFAVLDVQNVLNQTPFKKEQYLIRRIKGYGVKHKSRGSYDFVVLGNAFQPGRKVKVFLDKIELNPNDVMADRVANTLFFSVGVSLINDKFDDSKLKRLSLKISCSENIGKKSFYEYEGSILLLPKFPVKYRIIEKYKGLTWNGKKDWAIYQRPMGPTGKNEKWDHYTLVCHAPAGTRFTGKHQLSTSGSHSVCDGLQIVSNTKATAHCANQTHDAPRTATVKLEYQHSKEELKEQSVLLKRQNLPKGLLGYGTHFFDLSDKHVTYTATFTYFNGRVVVLYDKKPSEYGIKLVKEISPDGNYRRLIVEIDDPVHK